MAAVWSPEYRCPATKLHGVTTKENKTLKITVVKTPQLVFPTANTVRSRFFLGTRGSVVG
jgi:hypothetical protein